ncbi:uncharacterized protein LOC111328684 isoform X2 [Stylophora pistillata]|uniref:uncharacterized protein LOC111328684 isoform X2 n=1 Tax=Stylophora pistillata TaxID=50429 RepID=UPI000C046DA2|nr:uncharacterized protein LOC111328684 isoform X2 [Stylophora pistillata]
MALKKLTTVLLLLFCRFTLFFFITVLFSIFQGVPNLNICLLMIFLSYIVPLPPVSRLIHAIDRTLSHVSFFVRAYSLVIMTAQVIFIGLPCYVVLYLLYEPLENSLRYVVNHIRFTIPRLVFRTSAKMFERTLPWLSTLYDLLRLGALGASLLMKCSMWMAATVLSITSRLVCKVIHVFQRCAKYDDSTVCHSAFLEFSYSVWNLLRTGIFMLVSWNVNCRSWKPPTRDLTIIVESCLTLRNKSYFQLLFCAAGLPLLMKGHCFAQTVHNTISISNLLLFLVTLNGYHTRTASMMYHALCTVVINAQSTLVAVYNISRNLQTQRNGTIATLLYILELYLMLLVLLDSSTRVVKKVKNPKLDIMLQDS